MDLRKDVSVNDVFSRLTVVEILYGKGEKKCAVKCECGSEKIVLQRRLKNGHTKSCGCLSIDKTVLRSTKHGGHGTPVYAIWRAMINRTTSPSSKAWKDYGGRGIKVSEEWLIFDNFLKDMGVPKKGLELDRKNNDLGYSKENCRWISHKENCRNRRNTIFVFYNGEKISLMRASEICGINACTLRARHNAGKNGFELFRPVK